MEDKKITMPAVALRGLTILPGMVQHFDISREKSIRAIETAMMGNQKVYLVTQRHPEQETPAVADLYQMGTISQIKQLVKMPGGIIRVMVEGEKRAALLTLFEEGPYLEAEPSVIGIFFKSSIVSKDVPDVTERSLFPTEVLPIGMEKSADFKAAMMVFMFT